MDPFNLDTRVKETADELRAALVDDITNGIFDKPFIIVENYPC